MDETEPSRYWCHVCSQTGNPIVDTIQCPICQSGFVEEMPSEASPEENGNIPLYPDRALSLWAPILLGLMGNTRRRRRIERLGSDGEIDIRDLESENVELDRELESIFRRRRRNSAAILRLLRDMRTGLLSSSESGNTSEENDENEGARDRERVILINPFNQTIIVQGSYDHPSTNDREPIGSLGDYFVGPGLDVLLQHLSENDLNRYGTPPTRKEAVEALLNVRIEEVIQCAVCLDDCEIGVEVKEMPCKHKFHGECILPWLKLHSSCPMCRYQLPFDESKLNNGEGEGNMNNNNNSNGDSGDDRNESGRQFSVPLPWPFSGLFSSGSSSGSRSGGGDSIANSTSRDANVSGVTSSQEDDN